MTSKHLMGLSKVFLMAGLMFWAGETIFFMLRDGWHVNPSCPAEQICDGVSSIAMKTGFAVFIIALCSRFFEGNEVSNGKI